MEWIKKNKALVVVILIALVIGICWFLSSRKKKAAAAKLAQQVTPPEASTPAASADEAAAQKVRAELSDCEGRAQAMRLIPGTPHPCTKLRDQVAVLDAKAAPAMRTAPAMDK